MAKAAYLPNRKVWVGFIVAIVTAALIEIGKINGLTVTPESVEPFVSGLAGYFVSYMVKEPA